MTVFADHTHIIKSQWKTQERLRMVLHELSKVQRPTQHVVGHINEDISTGLMIQPTVSKH